MGEHNGAQRRAEVARILEEAAAPVSAAALARRLSVSRQIIVGDVALLRAGGARILATPRGYLLERRTDGVERTVACVHTPAETQAELNAIVDAGGEVVDVIVEHPVYGQLTGILGSPVPRLPLRAIPRRCLGNRRGKLALLFFFFFTL